MSPPAVKLAPLPKFQLGPSPSNSLTEKLFPIFCRYIDVSGRTTLIHNRSSLRLLILASLLFYGACVSVELGTNETKKADFIKLDAPNENYKPVFIKNLDLAWRNYNKNSTISYFTECTDKKTYDLEQTRQGLLTPLTASEILSEERSSTKKFKKLKSLVRSNMNNKKTFAEIAIYNAKKCLFIITHVTFDKDESKDIYEKFLDSFEGQL